MPDTIVRGRIMLMMYADIAAAHDYLVEVFGLQAGVVIRDDQDRVDHGEVTAGDGVIWLHPVQEDMKLAPPNEVGAATASMAILVDDVDAHFRHAREKGAMIEHEPVDQEYGYREYSARDPEGHLWSFMKALS
ncbi:VOC family protein [Micromonospora andamanensis]|uniref:Glyoxalase n=1 Tax=Micromonospora andamanensis TaxID=1287068 RepID=A0ABQ4HTM1_9ACTN|nr:VOC family protein [Micromonospora andamanensis]GIJ08960.1 glyoxalase [Micromonospora andamanensis]